MTAAGLPADHTHEAGAAEQSGMVGVRCSQLETSPLSATVEEPAEQDEVARGVRDPNA